MWVDFERIDEVHEDRCITNGVVEGASAGRKKKKKRIQIFTLVRVLGTDLNGFLRKRKCTQVLLSQTT